MTRIILLGLIQGVTEFLPISSSGHLVLFHHLLGDYPLLAFDVLAHFGTLLAIIYFFWPKLTLLSSGLLGRMGKKENQRQRHLFWSLVFSSLPIVLAGLFFGQKIILIFANPKFLVIGFWATALLLILGRFYRRPVKKGRFFLVGVCQTLAIIPGISRSASTIASNRIFGADREEAFESSFLLGLIAIAGAVVYEIPHIYRFNNRQIGEGLVVVLVSFLFGLAALKILRRLFLNNKMWYLSFYCFFLGLAVFFFL
jgi:undecaprenyl-diphosphatase